MVLGKREHSIGFCVVLFSKGVQNPTSGSKSEVRHGAASQNKIYLCRESCWTTTFRNRVLVTSNHHGSLRVFEGGALLAIGSFFSGLVCIYWFLWDTMGSTVERDWHGRVFFFFCSTPWDSAAYFYYSWHSEVCLLAPLLSYRSSKTSNFSS